MSHCFIRFDEELGKVVAIQKALGPKVYDDRMPSWLVEAAQEVVLGILLQRRRGCTAPEPTSGRASKPTKACLRHTGRNVPRSSPTSGSTPSPRRRRLREKWGGASWVTRTTK